MNYEQIKHGAELDSRRVATGVLCRIIYDDGVFDGLLTMLRGAGYWPQHVHSIPSDTGVDPQTGICILMPTHIVHFFKSEWESLSKSINDSFDETDENGKIDFAIGKTRRIRLRGEFLRNMQEHLMIGTIDIKEITELASGKLHEVLIDTREQNEPRARIVRKGSRDGHDPNTDPNIFDGRVNPSVQRWTDEQQRKKKNR